MHYRLAKFRVKEVIIDIEKGEHQTPEYEAVNPLGKVPCYIEPGFSLGESAAIMKYLVATNDIADHWYPGPISHYYPNLEDV